MFSRQMLTSRPFIAGVILTAFVAVNVVGIIKFRRDRAAAQTHATATAEAAARAQQAELRARQAERDARIAEEAERKAVAKRLAERAAVLAAVPEGKALFTHTWTENDPLSNGGDGLGPVFNENSCVACHFNGGVGGAGGEKQRVLAFEIHPAVKGEDVHSGVVHTFSRTGSVMESEESVRNLFAITRKNPVQTAARLRVFGRAEMDRFIAEPIDTPSLFGVGLIDQIPDNAITGQAARPRRLDEGIGKLGWKGQFASLDEFVANACAVELGLSNHVRAQDLPGHYGPDPNASPDMTPKQLHALISFCKTLPRPEQVLPEEDWALKRVGQGEQIFNEIGCVGCHTRKLGDVDGLYSDLGLHELEGPLSNVYYGSRNLFTTLPLNHPTPRQWKTPPLWGVADTAPYFHDGGSKTLHDAIVRHGGEAAQVTGAYKRLSIDQQDSLIAFLGTLRTPRTADLSPDVSLAMRTGSNAPKLPTAEAQALLKSRIEDRVKHERALVESQAKRERLIKRGVPIQSGPASSLHAQ